MAFGSFVAATDFYSAVWQRSFASLYKLTLACARSWTLAVCRSKCISFDKMRAKYTFESESALKVYC